MPQIGARMPHTTKDTVQYDHSHARCILEPEVVGRTAHKSLSDKTVLAWLLGNSAWSVIAILPRGLTMSGLRSTPVRVCGVALLFYCSPPMCARTHIFQRTGATFQPSRSKRTYLGASLTAIRLHSAACLRNASTGVIGGLNLQEIGGETHDLAVSSIRTRSNLGQALSGVASPWRVAVGESPSPGNVVCCSALVGSWQ
jgi:hypothetical protein